MRHFKKKKKSSAKSYDAEETMLHTMNLTID